MGLHLGVICFIFVGKSKTIIMATLKAIIYTSLKANGGVSILSAAIARMHATQNGVGGLTIKDTKGLSTSDITTFLGTTLVANTLDTMYVGIPSATSTASDVITYDQLAELDTRLKTASRGSVQNTVTSGTCESNSTGTQIILAAATASTVDDFYKGMYIKTTVGGVSTYRYITGYTGTSRICTVVTTGTAVTTTSTYIVYTQPNIYVIGDAVSSLTSAYEAWTLLFPGIQMPPLVSLMSGTGTVSSASIQPHLLVAQTADSFTISSVTKSAAFTSYLTQLNRGTCYLAAVSATTGAGQVVQILSATANVLTIVPFNTLPTGTLVFQVCTGNQFALYEIYLKYALQTYLNDLSFAPTIKAFQQLLDMLNVIPKGVLTPAYNATLLADYAARGRAIFDGVNAGYVTA